MQQMPLHLDQPSPGDIEVLLSHARTLKRAREPILKQQLLKGRNLALLCESVDDPDAALFMCAASEISANDEVTRPTRSSTTMNAAAMASAADSRRTWRPDALAAPPEPAPWP